MLPLCLSFWGISSGYAFASIFPNKKCPERELCHQALGAVAFTHLVEGACTLVLLAPPVLQTRSSSASWEALPRLGLPVSSREGQLLPGETGASTSQPLGRRKEGTVLSSCCVSASPGPVLL